jgi:hypothetical protein
MFEHRTEAEMRLYSDKLARELALKRRHKEGDVKNDPTGRRDARDHGNNGHTGPGVRTPTPGAGGAERSSESRRSTKGVRQERDPR